MEYETLTGEIYFGRIDNHTRPERRFVTAKARVNISARDCELFREQRSKHNIVNVQNSIKQRK